MTPPRHKAQDLLAHIDKWLSKHATEAEEKTIWQHVYQSIHNRYYKVKPISSAQRGALHVYCRQLSDDLNSRGIHQKTLLESLKNLELPNTEESVKDVFRGCARAMYPKIKSTEDLSPKELSTVGEAIGTAMAQRLGVSVQWPSREPSMLAEFLPSDLGVKNERK